MIEKFSEDQKKDAVKLYQEGKTIAEIKIITGISVSYIKNLLKKYNVHTRPVGFQPYNYIRKGKLHLQETKDKISTKHKMSGHKPSKEAAAKGQPLSLKATWKNHIKDPVEQFIKIYKQGAAKRSLDFHLTREAFESLINRSCYYCGSSPALRKVNGSDLICNGIDREDNNKGYYIGNCLPCCKICNIMKSTLSRDEFIEHCRKIGRRFVDAN
jgi:transposase